MKGPSGFVIFIALLSIFGVEGYDVKCKGVDLSMTEQELMHMTECLKVIKVAKFEDINGDNVGCFSKCGMEKMGLVDEDRKAHKENIKKIISTMHPDEKLMESMMEGIGACLDNEGSHLLKIEDDAKCSSYMPLATCAHIVFMGVCT